MFHHRTFLFILAAHFNHPRIRGITNKTERKKKKIFPRRITLHLLENSSLEVSEKRRNRSNTSTGTRPDGKASFFKASFLTREGNNPMTVSDFNWMVSNHAVWGWKAPVKTSVSGVSLLQLSPFFDPSFPFSPRNA